MKPSVLIIGTGIGGLTTALRLVKKGYNVSLVEKNAKAGGRLNQLKKDGFTFDTGPSFFSMSYEFEAFARDCHIRLPFHYHPVDPLYTVHFRNQPQPFRLYRDTHLLAARFETAEPGFEEKMNRYLDACRKIFDGTVDIVVKQNFDSFPDYVKKLAAVDPSLLPVLFSSFWKQVCRYFSSDDARQIVSLVSFFLGGTPFETNGVYTLLSYTEFRHDGYYNVEGGMYRITEGLVAELAKENVLIRYNAEIVAAETDSSGIRGFVDSNGIRHTADLYVVNADAAVFRGRILGRKKYSERKLRRMDWTMGMLTFYIGLDCRLPEIALHNYYLGNNYRDYARRVFRRSDTAEKPYFYVNVVSRHNPGCAPEGGEALLFVVPVPDLRFKADWSDRDSVVDHILDDFSLRIGSDIRPHIVSRTVYTPEDWANQFNLYQGSGLGLAHSMMQVGALRPKNFDEVFNNLFYVGASTVPGTGLPMGVIGSKLVTERIEKSFPVM